ncbi:hypothetical protein D7X33_02945 [Butyricicoccus sp. 1XD8-22]|nr:hypothetical protein D7X33_02945 [Butyricicoccus sp. 1XD8-22]
MESLSPPAGGRRLRGGRSYADSAKGASPFGIPSTACWRETPGPARTAPKGLAPLESLSPPAGGSRLRGGRSYADSAKGASPFGIPFSACGREPPARRAVLRGQRQRG